MGNDNAFQCEKEILISFDIEIEDPFQGLFLFSEPFL